LKHVRPVEVLVRVGSLRAIVACGGDYESIVGMNKPANDSSAPSQNQKKKKKKKRKKGFEARDGWALQTWLCLQHDSRTQDPMSHDGGLLCGDLGGVAKESSS
jgi:hypothetical protein